MIAQFQAWLFGVALRALHWLKPETASNLGGAIARTIGPWLPVSRVARINLRLALPHLDDAEHRRILRAAWDNLGRTAAELPHVPDLPENTFGPGWEIENPDLLRSQVARGGAVIFMSGHIGNWEVLPLAVARYGISMSSIYRSASNPGIAGHITAIRTRALGRENAMFPKGSAGARQALRHLAAGGGLGMLMDQKMNDGIAVPFFGHEAMTAPALAMLALRQRCPVLPGYVRRIGPARLRVIVHPPLPLPETGNHAEDIRQLTAQVNAMLESWIREWPEGWLWMHRRWPKSLYRRG